MDKGIFKLDATTDTPLFSVDTTTNVILIKGVSMPENSFEFFDPLEKKAIELFENHKGDLALNVELEYINSMTSKQLLKLIKQLSSRNPNLKVRWGYFKDDDLIRMKGEEIKSICNNTPVEVVELVS